MRRSSIALLSSLMFACSLTARGGDSPPVRLELDATGAPSGRASFPHDVRGDSRGPHPRVSEMDSRRTRAERSLEPDRPADVHAPVAVPLTWHRDDLDIFLFHVDVPEGVSEVRADLDFACVLGQEGFQSDICSSYDQLVVNWWLVVLYPPSLPNDRDPFLASIRLPAGWKYNTSLPLAHESLAQHGGIRRSAAQDPGGLAADRGEIPSHLSLGRPVVRVDGDFRRIRRQPRSSGRTWSGTSERMVAETEAEFGGPRYTKYNLQISLGDAIDHYTLEHFESSENRLPSTGLSDPRVLLTTATMIPHEYIHSWNGKYRTPVGLDITTYQDPMKAGLIWVYEGLTDYISGIMAVRSGFWSEDQLRQSLAIDAAEMTYHTGRTWRSLQDTTVGAQMLLVSPNAWVSARRNTDFYPECGLMWLEADAIIRQSSGGRRSLDDFCRLFFAPHARSAPYTFEDVVNALEPSQPVRLVIVSAPSFGFPLRRSSARRDSSEAAGSSFTRTANRS